MTEIPLPPLHDLPRAQVELRKRHLLSEITSPQRPSTIGLRPLLVAAVVVVAALALVPIGGASLGSRAVDGIGSLWASPPNQPALDRAAEDAENIAGKAYYTEARVDDGANQVDVYMARAPRSVIDQLRTKHPGIYVIHNDAANTWRQMLRVQRSLDFLALQAKGIDIESSAPTSNGYLEVAIRGHHVRSAQTVLDSRYGAGIIKVVGGAEPLNFGGRPIDRGRRAHVSKLAIPAGAHGIGVVVYGRLSVTTTTGHFRGMRVSEAALSPGARYVAAGIGNSIAELTPNGKRVWSQPLGVRGCPRLDKACDVVAALSWAPNGSRIAYLVRTPTRRLVLHVIRSDGTHDTVIDRNARPGQPSWRADSRALAYIGAGTRPVVYDLAHGSRRVIDWPIARSPATHLAFAPHGSELAIGTETAALLVGRGQRVVVWRGQTHGVSWLGSRLAVSARVGTTSFHVQIQLYRVLPSAARLVRIVRVPSPILATNGRTLALLGAVGVGKEGVLAGPLGSLRRVVHFKVVGCDPEACEIPIGDHDVSIG